VAVKTAPKKKAAPLPEWKSTEAEAMMKRRTNAFMAKHGTTEAFADLQVLLTLSTKLTGYRRPAQMICAYKAPEPEVEEEDETEEEAAVAADTEEEEEEE
jgi:hypothetical protein